MKREEFLRLLSIGGLSFCIAFGGAGCVVTGFGFESVNLGVVLLWSVLCAVVIPISIHFRMGLGVLCTAALFSGYLWRLGPLERSVEALLYRISYRYDSGYGFGILRWTGEPINEATITMALCLGTFLIVYLLASTLYRRRRLWVALPVSLIPLIACIVLTDTVPAAGYLFMELFGTVLILLTHGVRRRDPRQELRLSTMLALPVALGLGLLLLLNPRSTYDKQDGAVKLENFVQKLYNAFTTPEGLTDLTEQVKIDFELPVTGDSTDSVNLSNVGPKNKQTQHIMSVTAAQNGTLYLRGQSMDYYDGTNWTTTHTSDSVTSWPYASELETVGTVTITTKSAHSVLYVPYYNSTANWYESMDDGALLNSRDLKTYTVQQSVLPEWYSSVWTGDYRSYEESMQSFLQLPEQTRAWASALASEILGRRVPLDEAEITQAHVDEIVRYVRNSASYSLNTDRMPSGEADFARWFLEDSDTGYCIHFATATTVLLRAAGVPARYVTGYMLQGQQDVAVVVRMGDAHAWTEYRLPRKAWMVAEGTPGGGSSPVATTPDGSTVPQPDDTQGTEPVQTTPDGETVQSTTSATEDLPVWTWEGQPTIPQSPDQPLPGTQGGAEAPQERPKLDLGWLWKVLKVLLGICVAVGAAIGQWWLRLNLRRKKQYTGPANRQALARWREVVLLAKLRGVKPDSELLGLAQKAKYSHHTLTKEELQCFHRSIMEAKAHLRGKGPVWQLFYRLILALY